MDSVNINQERLWESIETMSKIGKTKDGGVSRVALTRDDIKSRNLFIEWCKKENLKITIDPIGNIFARRDGELDDLPPVLVGSHLDTQPKGGKYDGTYGVLAALEAIRTLNEHKIKTKRAIEICNWTNEEGVRFSPAMLGSAVFCGLIDINTALEIKDNKGIKLSKALEEIGVNIYKPMKKHNIDSYFEAHIEQGPVLEKNNKDIGIVEGGQSIKWIDLLIIGEPRHAGTTPLLYRKDAIRTAAKIIVDFEEKVLSRRDESLFTFGEINIENQSRNTIPGLVKLSVDIRNPKDYLLDEIENELLKICHNISNKHKIDISHKEIWRSFSVNFDHECINIIESSAKKCNYSYMKLISGAGHDAFNLSKICPTGMIFIPCLNGISHNPKESISINHSTKGANVLLHSILTRANK